MLSSLITLVSSRLIVDVDSKFLLPRGLHGLLMNELEMLQAAVSGLIGAEIPCEETIVCTVEDLADAPSILQGHYFVVGINMREVVAI